MIQSIQKHKFQPYQEQESFQQLNQTVININQNQNNNNQNPQQYQRSTVYRNSNNFSSLNNFQSETSFAKLEKQNSQHMDKFNNDNQNTQRNSNKQHSIALANGSQQLGHNSQMELVIECDEDQAEFSSKHQSRHRNETRNTMFNHSEYTSSETAKKTNKSHNGIFNNYNYIKDNGTCNSSYNNIFRQNKNSWHINQQETYHHRYRDKNQTQSIQSCDQLYSNKNTQLFNNSSHNIDILSSNYQIQNSVSNNPNDQSLHANLNGQQQQYLEHNKSEWSSSEDTSDKEQGPSKRQGLQNSTQKKNPSLPEIESSRVKQRNRFKYIARFLRSYKSQNQLPNMEGQSQTNIRSKYDTQGNQKNSLSSNRSNIQIKRVRAQTVAQGEDTQNVEAYKIKGLLLKLTVQQESQFIKNNIEFTHGNCPIEPNIQIAPSFTLHKHKRIKSATNL